MRGCGQCPGEVSPHQQILCTAPWPGTFQGLAVSELIPVLIATWRIPQRGGSGLGLPKDF